MSLPFGGDSTPGFRRHPGDTTSDDRGGGEFFAMGAIRRRQRASVCRWAGILEAVRSRVNCVRGNLSSRKSQVRRADQGVPGQCTP